MIDLAKDNLCEFGKWLSTGIGVELKKDSEYAKAVEIHKELHKLASHILELALSGKKDEAKKKLGFGSSYALTSANLTKTLIDWKHKYDKC